MYYPPTIPEVWHSINTSIGKCFKKNNQELNENLEKTFGIFCNTKIKKIKECQLRKVIMNIAISEACKQASDAKKGKIEIRPAFPFVPESTVESDSTNKNSVTCMYRPSAGDSKKNNYVIQAKHYETGTTEDVLRWYITLQEIFEKKSCEDAEAKFGIVELLLGGQGKKDFIQYYQYCCT